MFGVGVLESSKALAGNIYGADATQRTYARLLEMAREILAAGFPVIVDAAFLKQDEREKFRMLAQTMSVPFAIATLTAAEQTLRARIDQRRNDASEADVTVLEMLQAKQQPLSPDETSCAAQFTTEETPDRAGNLQGWNKLNFLLGSS